jgi:hypothetical protein
MERKANIFPSVPDVGPHIFLTAPGRRFKDRMHRSVVQLLNR